MPRYKYIIKTPKGRTKRGAIDAADRREAMSELRQDGSIVIELKKRYESLIEKKLIEFNSRLGPKEKAQLFSELSYLLPIGNSLHASLNMLLRYNKNKNWQNTIKQLIKGLDDTGSLSAALEATGKFGNDVIYQVLSGEESGNLPEVLEKLSKSFEKSTGYLRKFIVLMVYPVLLLLGLNVAISFISAEIIPQIVAFVAEMGGEIPRVSKIVFAVSLTVSRNKFIYMAIFLLLMVIFMLLLKNKSISYMFDRVKLKTPVIGSILRDIDMVRFNKVFAAMYESGNELETTLSCARETLKNTYLSKLAKDAAKEIIEAGTVFTNAFNSSGLFTPEDVQLIDVGAETYSLSAVLEKIAEKKSDEIDYRITTLTNSIPLLSIIVIGVIIGIFVIGIYLPLTSIAGGNINISY